MTVADDGTLHKWTDMRNLPGMACWFAVRTGSDKFNSCLFTTYADASSIESYQWTPTGMPTKVQTLPVGDKNANPVYADISTDGGTLVVANYHGPDDGTNSTGASVQTFSISTDCHLTAVDLKPHSGSSINKARQSAAHPHSAVVGRDNLLFVCDLGMDVIFTYNVTSSGKLTELARTPAPKGSGPRHSVLHPTKPFLFVVSEMGSRIDTYKIGNGNGDWLTYLEGSGSTTLPSNDPDGYGSKAAEIQLTKDGRHLYASNRAFNTTFKDTIAVFDVSDDGKLTLTQQMPSPAFPRGMTLTPDGKFLLVASQTDGKVVSFKLDASSGHLSATGGADLQGPWGAAAFAILPEKAAEAKLTVV
jgi:6-phosphogluconolactonase